MILEKLNYKILTVRNPDNLKVMESGNTKTMYRNTASLHVILVKYSILNAQDRDNTNRNRYKILEKCRMPTYDPGEIDY